MTNRIPLASGTAIALCLAVARAALAQQSDYGASLSPPPLAPADGVLPRSFLAGGSADVRGGLLGDSAGGADPGLLPSSGWTVHAQAGLSEEWTDNAGLAVGGLGARGRPGSDFVTELAPAVTVQRETPRLTVNLDYDPVGLLYADHSSFSQIEQFGTADVRFAAIPEWLYLDARASVSEQAVYGSVSPLETVAVSPGDRETNASFALSPYLSHCFGSLWTAQLGASYSYSDTQAPSQAQSVAPGISSPYGAGYLATVRVFASAATGDDFGRLQDRASLDDSMYDGSGALRGAHRLIAADDASYALMRRLAVLGQAGFEGLSYPEAAFSYVGPVGAVGLRYSPRRDSSLTVEYRFVDGRGAAFVHGSLQATARIRVFGGYSEGVTTFQQDQQGQLEGGTLDEAGVPDSAALSVPLMGGSSSFPGNQQVSLLRRADLSVAYVASRDTVTLSLQDERMTPVGRPLAGVQQTSSSGFFAVLGWTRELSPEWRVDGSVQYGSDRIDLSSATTARTASFSAGATRTFSPSLSAYARFQGTYSLARARAGVAGGYGLGDQDAVTVGVLKRF